MTNERYLVLSTFKNEGPFVLEWIAYHKSIGFDDFLIYTNDCDDGTDRILDRLQELGHVQHRDNKRRGHQRPSPQARAYRKALREPIYTKADWVAIIDSDEFVNIHVGEGRIRDLTAAVNGANAISLTWRLFGCANQTNYRRGFLTETFIRAAPKNCPRPPQAWGLKTIFRREAFEGLGVHRPRTPTAGDWGNIRWVNGGGVLMPEYYHTRHWRSNRNTYSYELAQINHYATRFRESFLVKQARGRAFGGFDLDLDYWNKMDRNEKRDKTILSKLPNAHKIYDELLADTILSDLHIDACEWHSREIARLREETASADLLASLVPEFEGATE